MSWFLLSIFCVISLLEMGTTHNIILIVGRQAGNMFMYWVNANGHLPMMFVLRAILCFLVYKYFFSEPLLLAGLCVVYLAVYFHADSLLEKTKR